MECKNSLTVIDEQYKQYICREYTIWYRIGEIAEGFLFKETRRLLKQQDFLTTKKLLKWDFRVGLLRSSIEWNKLRTSKSKVLQLLFCTKFNREYEHRWRKVQIRFSIAKQYLLCLFALPYFPQSYFAIQFAGRATSRYAFKVNLDFLREICCRLWSTYHTTKSLWIRLILLRYSTKLVVGP